MADALLVTSSFLPGMGGIESYLSELCDELAPRIAVIAPGERDGRTVPRDLPYRTFPMPGMPLPGPRTLRAIESAAAELGTKRVLFGTPWPLVLLGPRLARRGFTYAVIAHGAELIAPSAAPFLRGYLARSLRGAALLLAVSDYTAGHLRRLVGTAGSPPIERLRARVDLDRFSPDADGESARARLGAGARPLVVTLGRLVARKGVDRLIEAMPAVRVAIPNALLVIGGTGPEERRLRRIAQRTDAEVTFAGRVPDEETPGLYAAADVFALPVADRWFGLDVEGLGVVLLEAAACGTACVAGRSGGTSEAVVHGETGLLVDARDRGAVTVALATLLTDRERARRMGLAGRRHVERNFAGSELPEALYGWLS